MPINRVSAPSVASVQQRLKASVDELMEADRKNPDQDMVGPRGNPYGVPPGNNGSVDKKEAATTSKTAQAMWGAAGKAFGDRVVEGGGGGWVEKAYAKSELSGVELRRLQMHAQAIVGNLAGPDGTISDDKLANLPTLISDYWVQNFGSRQKLIPEQVDAIATLVKDAVAGD
jgi:hypothetical protein